MALLLHFLRETFKNLWIHRVATFLTLLIVATGALIFEAFALLSHNLSRIVERGRDGLFIELYFKDGVPEPRQSEILGQASALPEARSASWTSQQQALESFRAQGYAQLLEGVDGNPLPASLLLELRPEISLAKARALAQRLAEAPEMDGWSDSGELAERLAALDSVVRSLVLVVGAFLALVLGFLIAGTVRLALDSRRGEMEILELLGATSTFIRLPFVLEGTLLGALGGGLSVGALYGLYRLAIRSLDLGDTLLLGIGSIEFLDGLTLASCCAVTAILGCGSSLLVTRHREA